MTSLRAFLALLAETPRRHRLALAGLMALVAATDGIGILLLVPLLEMLQDAGGSHNALVTTVWRELGVLDIKPGIDGLLLLFVSLVAFRSAVQYGRDRLGAVLQYRVIDQLRLRCFGALLAVEWRWMVATRQADHASQLITDISRVGVGLNQGLALLVSVVTAVAYLVAAALMSWQITVLAMASGGCVFMLLARQRRRALRLGEHLGRANRLLYSNVQESLAGMKLAKILCNERRYLDVVGRSTARLRQQQQQFATNTSLSKSLFQLAGAVMLAVYVDLGLRVWQIPLSQLLILVLVFARMIPLFMQGLQQSYQWLHALPALQQAQQLLNDCRAHAEPVGDGGSGFWPIEENISVDGVSVRYEGREQAALDTVSIRFDARTTTAVMGESGAGKSTLADVLMGLLAPDAGQLRVDGVAVEGGARQRWRHSVAYVPQDVFLFNDTIRNNLLWGRPDATDSELVRVLRLAAAEFVFALPQGLDTVVGDGGRQLSGGERQRLALARALLKKPALLILDEATSALDRENEARIREAIENLHGNLTVVLIGHRLPTLEHADLVIVLADGKVAARGSWHDVRTRLVVANA